MTETCNGAQHLCKIATLMMTNTWKCSAAATSLKWWSCCWRNRHREWTRWTKLDVPVYTWPCVNKTLTVCECCLSTDVTSTYRWYHLRVPIVSSFGLFRDSRGTRKIMQKTQKKEKRGKNKKTYKKQTKNTSHGAYIVHNRLYIWPRKPTGQCYCCLTISSSLSIHSNNKSTSCIWTSVLLPQTCHTNV